MKKSTPIFIILIILVIAIYDFFIISKQGNSESISAYLLSMGEVTPFLNLLLGLVFGHLTWPNRTSLIHNMKRNYFSYSFFAIFTPMAIYDFYQGVYGSGNFIINNYKLGSLVPFIVGYISGHYVWPMSPVHWSKRFKKDEK